MPRLKFRQLCRGPATLPPPPGSLPGWKLYATDPQRRPSTEMSRDRCVGQVSLSLAAFRQIQDNQAVESKRGPVTRGRLRVTFPPLECSLPSRHVLGKHLQSGRSAGHGPKHLPSINSFSTYREVGTGVIHILWMRKRGCREVKPLAQGRPGRKWRSRGFCGANRRMTQEMNN